MEGKEKAHLLYLCVTFYPHFPLKLLAGWFQDFKWTTGF